MSAPPPARPGGMRAFGIVWSGQVVSRLGTAVAQFAFVVNIWRSGGSATDVVLLSLLTFLPRMLLSPLAGALVDRWDRRVVLQMADLGGVVAIGGLTLAQVAGQLSTWHVYLAMVVLGAAEAFQFPALAAAIPQLVPQHRVQTANGLVSAARSVGDIGGPALGALLVVTVGLDAILTADLLSYLFAIATVWLVRIPRRAESTELRTPLAVDALTGLRHILSVPGLRALVALFFVVSFAAVFGFSVTQPMILARSGDSAMTLAAADAAIGFGTLLGGALLWVWRGPRRRIMAMLVGIAVTSVSAHMTMAVVRGAPAWFAASLVGAAFVPFINGALASTVQGKTPAALHGRVFGAVFFLSQLAALLAMILSGPLADHVFEPQARTGTGVAGVLRPIVGDGPGSGMAAMLFLAGLCGLLAAVVGFLHRDLRDIDRVGSAPDDPKPLTVQKGRA
ncbi:MFS transporter [Kutzneria sp. NPDC052558]|uniref:MFS transporter n=1 Tax=Kutzneria sp. NPDC052558 TaxID=3364121 RepID=UPI0037C92C4D